MSVSARRQEKARRRREEILRSAASAFRRKGFHATTMDDISRALLMTKGSLYYYFKNKEEILFACHDFSLNHILSNLARAGRPECAPPEALRELIQGHVAIMIDDLQASSMAIEFDALSTPLLEQVIGKRDRYERGFRRIVKRGMDEGCFRVGDPKLVSFAILGAVNWIVKWYSPTGPVSAEEVGRVFADFFVQGLEAGSGPVREK